MEPHKHADFYGQSTNSSNNEFSSRTAYINHQPYISNSNNTHNSNHNATHSAVIDNISNRIPQQHQQPTMPKKVCGSGGNSNNNNNNNNVLCTTVDCQCQARCVTINESNWPLEQRRSHYIGAAAEGTTQQQGATTTLMKQTANLYTMQQQQPVHHRPYWSQAKPPVPPPSPQLANTEVTTPLMKYHEHHIVKCKPPTPQQFQQAASSATGAYKALTPPYSYPYAVAAPSSKEDLKHTYNAVPVKSLRPNSSFISMPDKRQCSSTGSSSGGSGSSKAEHIINPLNEHAGAKEQHLSPNHARKCPQIFALAEQQHLQQQQQQQPQQQHCQGQSQQQQQTHLSLYVSTPHFSSDKFINSSGGAQTALPPPQELRYNNNLNAQMHGVLEHAGPQHEKSHPLMGYQQPYLQQQPLHNDAASKAAPSAYYSGLAASHTARSLGNYYNPINAKIDYASSPAPPDQYQYSKTALPPSPVSSTHYMGAAKPPPPPSISNRDELPYVKQEMDSRYGSPLSMTPVKPHNLYVNPYNVTPPTPPESSRIKKETSPFAPTPEPPSVLDYQHRLAPSSLSASPSTLAASTPPYDSHKPDKFNKCSPILRGPVAYYPQQSQPAGRYEDCYSPYPTSVSHTSGALKYQQTPPPPSTQHHLRPLHTPSPALPQPPTQQQAYAQHVPLSSPQPAYPTPNSISAYHQQQQYAVDNRRCSTSTTTMATQSASVVCYNMHKTPTTVSTNYSTSQQLPHQQSHQQPQQQHQAANAKKAQVPKPNYRELINQVYALRNATTEQELNMQIIKKTLNVDAAAHVTRESLVAPLPIETAVPGTALSSVVAPIVNVPTVHPPTSAQLPPRSALALPKCTPAVDSKPVRIKVEPEKLCNSPLDLSMRTVKTKADSTDYKYHNPQQSPMPRSADYKFTHALPRVDFTPNFSLHTENASQNASAARVDRSPNVYAPAVAPLPPPAILAARHTKQALPTSFHAASQAPVAPSRLHFESPHIRSGVGVVRAVPPSQMVAPCPYESRPKRATVVEPNPLITARLPVNATQELPRPAVEQLPPETSIVALSKSAIQTPAANVPVYTSLKQTPPQSSYVAEFERNPNFLGKKRHLHEYSNAMHNEELLLAKQARYEATTPAAPPLQAVAPTKLLEYVPRAQDVSVIAVNAHCSAEPKTAEKCIQAFVPFAAPPPPLGKEVTVVTTKPTAIVGGTVQQAPPPPSPTTVAAVKTETNMLIAARIRTKAELKGFTFNPPPPTMPNVTAPPPSPPPKEVPAMIKTEPFLPVELQTEVEEDLKQSTLLDFSWSKACNNFVEQLLTTPAATTKTKPAIVEHKPFCVDCRVDQRDAASSVSETPFSESLVTSTYAQLTTDNSQDNRLLESYRMSADKEASCQGRAKCRTSVTWQLGSGRGGATQQIVIQKKTLKLDREKMRAQQEQRLAARLQQAGGSSSETDNELDKRKSERLKKPTKKGKLRSIVGTGAGKKGCSDCGSDTSSDQEAEPNATMPMGKQEQSSNGNSSTAKEKLKKSVKKRERQDGPNDRKSNIGLLEETSTTSSVDDVEPDGEGIAQDEGEEEDAEQIANGRKSNNSTKAITASIGAVEKVMDTGKGCPAQDARKMGNNNKVQYTKVPRKAVVTTTDVTAPTAATKKVYLNTMTRSKRKRELELQIANSKVLRNDKIIRNSNLSTTKIKRKYVRKYSVSQRGETSNSNSGSGGSAAKKDTTMAGQAKTAGDNRQIIVTRLRSRTDKQLAAMLKKNGNQRQLQQRRNSGKSHKKSGEMLVVAKGTGDAAATPSHKKRERPGTDIFMEVYHYKRSLKIPPSLITIKRPLTAGRTNDATTGDGIATSHKTAESLPDLERCQYYGEQSSSNDARRQRGKSVHGERLLLGAKASHGVVVEQPKSIIDLLHSRVVHNTALLGLRTNVPPCTINGNSTAAPCSAGTVHIAPLLNKKKTVAVVSNHYQRQTGSEASNDASVRAPCDLPLLEPSHSTDDDNDGDDENAAKKKHFSIFDTKVLQTKTRTESKLQQRKEIIREIFVGNDRPASAPPEMIQPADECGAGGEAMTYEQKYEQFLQQMNGVNVCNFGQPLHLRLEAAGAGSAAAAYLAVAAQAALNVKREYDTESVDAEESQRSGLLPQRNNESPMPLTTLKRRRPGKYLRRKGSSGFDYLRKKKRYNTGGNNCGGGGSTLGSAAANSMRNSERTAEEFYRHRTKTEIDVCREIQKWVLNKGVGQSTMHKAARLGYIDVIVYCLDRMGVNPDQKDNAGYTPLHEACTNGWLEIARLLLQYGANHSEAAHSGIRPLHEASENDHEEIVRLLLSYGADPLLATYADQTPLMLASTSMMRDLLNNHLSDVQNYGPHRTAWRGNGPWEIIDSSECGFNIFDGAPDFTCDMSTALRKRTVSSSMLISRKLQLKQLYEDASTNVKETKVKQELLIKMEAKEPDKDLNTKTVLNASAGVLDNTVEQQPQEKFNAAAATATVVRVLKQDGEDEQKKPEFLLENTTDSDGEIFEFEEADVLLPPLYLLKDEGSTDKWVLLNDLCNLLKVKSKDTLLNKICPASSMSAAHKSLMRELKMSDFLERATCLQLLCAGEKLNICASKVVLIKYNESVKNLLGVKTILMKF